MRYYRMHRYEIIAPHVCNDGTLSGYAQAFRNALQDADITGWTETESMGYWRGKAEPGTTFHILRMQDDLQLLGNIARSVMVEQGDIQVTYTGMQDLYEF